MKNFFIGKKKPEFYKGLLIKADSGLHDQIAETILKEVPRGGSILDMGAGEGALTLRLIDLGYKLTAADKDEEFFKAKGATFHKLNFDSVREVDHFVDLHNDKFDVVIGVEVIEHVQDQWKYLRQLFTMTKPGGLVLISTPNITSWISRINFFISGRFHQFGDGDLAYGHINPVSPWELELMFKECSGTNVSVVPAGTLPPVYITGFNKMLFFNLAIIFLRPWMKGVIDGWCVIATARKQA